jgi:hypothetical protein
VYVDREELLDEVITAYLKAAESGQDADPDTWLRRYPDLAEELIEFFAGQQSIDRLAGGLRQQIGARPRLRPSRRQWARAEQKHLPASLAVAAITSCSKRSPAAAWASSSRPARSS